MILNKSNLADCNLPQVRSVIKNDKVELRLIEVKPTAALRGPEEPINQLEGSSGTGVFGGPLNFDLPLVKVMKAGVTLVLVE